MEETASWKQGKSYHHNLVKTSHRKKGPKDGAAWYARVSEHDKEDATFEEFWNKLGEDKAENEMQYVVVKFSCSVRRTQPHVRYVPEIEKVQLIKQISPNQSVWTLFYRFPPPVSPRVFTVVQTTWLSETSPRTGQVGPSVMFASIGTDPPPTGIGLSFLFLLMYPGMLMPRCLKKRA